MDSLMISEIAERACKAENLDWPILRVSPNRAAAGGWEVYFDAMGRKPHIILFRPSPEAGSTDETLEAELRCFLRELKESGLL